MTVGYMQNVKTIPLLATSGATTGKAIALGSMSYGSVFIPAGETMVTLTFWAGKTEADAAFLQMYDGGTAISLTVAAGRWYRLPTDIFCAPWVRIVADAASTTVGGIPLAFGY